MFISRLRNKLSISFSNVLLIRFVL